MAALSSSVAVENCSLLGTDNILLQISVLIFASIRVIVYTYPTSREVTQIIEAKKVLFSFKKNS